jgi:hypothetical protein
LREPKTKLPPNLSDESNAGIKDDRVTDERASFPDVPVAGSYTIADVHPAQVIQFDRDPVRI